MSDMEWVIRYLARVGVLLVDQNVVMNHTERQRMIASMIFCLTQARRKLNYAGITRTDVLNHIISDTSIDWNKTIPAFNIL